MVTPTIADDRNLGYTLGAADYPPKPIDRERLTAVLAGNRRDRPPGIVLLDLFGHRWTVRGIHGRWRRQVR